MKEERNRTLQQQTTDKYNRFIVLHLRPIGSYSSDDPEEKKHLKLSLWANMDR